MVHLGREPNLYQEDRPPRCELAIGRRSRVRGLFWSQWMRRPAATTPERSASTQRKLRPRVIGEPAWHQQSLQISRLRLDAEDPEALLRQVDWHCRRRRSQTQHHSPDDPRAAVPMFRFEAPHQPGSDEIGWPTRDESELTNQATPDPESTSSTEGPPENGGFGPPSPSPRNKG